MSTVKICDRCGKVCKPSKYSLKVQPYRYFIGMETATHFKEWDLCFDCMLKVLNVLEDDDADKKSDEHVDAGGLYRI